MSVVNPKAGVLCVLDIDGGVIEMEGTDLEANRNVAGHGVGIHTVNVNMVQYQIVDGRAHLLHINAAFRAIGNFQLTILVGGIFIAVVQSQTAGITGKIKGAAVHTSTTDRVAIRAAGFHTAVEVVCKHSYAACKGDFLSRTCPALENDAPAARNLIVSVQIHVVGDIQLTAGFQSDQVHAVAVGDDPAAAAERGVLYHKAVRVAVQRQGCALFKHQLGIRADGESVAGAGEGNLSLHGNGAGLGYGVVSTGGLLSQRNVSGGFLRRRSGQQRADQASRHSCAK